MQKMSENDAIFVLKRIEAHGSLPIKAKEVAIQALEEIQQYRAIGTVEELQEAVKEEDVLKFYYIESEDKYVIGKRIGNFYYAEFGETRFVFYMSRYLPWGQHIVSPSTLWKEHTYPSEPKEIPFFEWLQGFIKKECGGSLEECREAVERMKPKKVKKIQIPNTSWSKACTRFECPSCNKYLNYMELSHCGLCGQCLDWSE